MFYGRRLSQFGIEMCDQNISIDKYHVVNGTFNCEPNRLRIEIENHLKRLFTLDSIENVLRDYVSIIRFEMFQTQI